MNLNWIKMKLICIYAHMFIRDKYYMFLDCNVLLIHIFGLTFLSGSDPCSLSHNLAWLHSHAMIVVACGCVIQPLNMEANISARLPPQPPPSPPPSNPPLPIASRESPGGFFAAHSLGCWGVRGIQYLPRKAGAETPTHRLTRLQPYMFFENLHFSSRYKTCTWIRCIWAIPNNNEIHKNIVSIGRDTHYST